MYVCSGEWRDMCAYLQLLRAIVDCWFAYYGVNEESGRTIQTSIIFEKFIGKHFI